MRCAVAFLIIAAAAPCRGQSDSTGLHATLAEWAEDAWLRLLDRDAARDGRLSDQGILQRFNPTIDPDYQINLIRARFGLLDDADWARHPRGARYWGGSINTRDFAEGAEFKEVVPLGRRWSTAVDFTKQDLPELTRSLVRIGFVRRTDAGFFSSIEGTLVPLKPSSDLEAGAGWRRPGRELALYVAVLDAFNDLIYQDLDAAYAATRRPGARRLPAHRADDAGGRAAAGARRAGVGDRDLAGAQLAPGAKGLQKRRRPSRGHRLPGRRMERARRPGTPSGARVYGRYHLRARCTRCDARGRRGAGARRVAGAT